MSQPPNSSGFNVNSIVTAIATAMILGVVGWFGSKSVDNNDKLTRMEISLPYLVQSISDLKVQINGLVTRAELDVKVNELKTDNGQLTGVKV